MSGPRTALYPGTFDPVTWVTSTSSSAPSSWSIILVIGIAITHRKPRPSPAVAGHGAGLPAHHGRPAPEAEGLGFDGLLAIPITR